MAWIIIFLMTVLSLIDVSFGIGIILLRYGANIGNAVVMLVGALIISFLFIAYSRMWPLNEKKFMAWVRGGIGLLIFLIFNF